MEIQTSLLQGAGTTRASQHDDVEPQSNEGIAVREGEPMRARILCRTYLLWSLVWGPHASAQSTVAATVQESDPTNSRGTANTQSGASAPQIQQTAHSLEEIIERVTQRERQETETISSYRPIFETYVQNVRADAQMGTLPKSDFYFLGQADFRGQLKVHSMLERTRKGNLLWSFNPAGFLQMIFVDRGEFDKNHYKFTYARKQFLGEVRCFVFDVARLPKVHGPRFVGQIWVEDKDFNIVRINGLYAPEIHFSLRHFEDEFYLHFDSWRINAKPGLGFPLTTTARNWMNRCTSADRDTNRRHGCGATGLRRIRAKKN